MEVTEESIEIEIPAVDEGIIERLIRVIEVVMDINTPKMQRAAAYKVIEDFKENSPLCVQSGLHLASKDRPAIVRHFGLQLIEHCVKFRWYKLSPEEITFIKDSVLKLVAGGTLDLMVEETYVKDCMARLVVEIMKREWPQRWQDLIDNFYKICAMGPTQTELVFMILLRVAEDVAVLQNLSGQRRKDMHLALGYRMEELFPFFVNTLKSNAEGYREKKALDSEGEAMVCCKLAQAALQALTGYVDWVPMGVIVADNDLLLQMLCLLLGDDQLQVHAAETLLLIVSRRGKVEDRKPMLVLFCDEAMSLILDAAVAAASSSHHDEYYYLFLKKLCQLLTTLGQQLCELWGHFDDVNQPPNFSKYLEAIMAFTNHPSQTLSRYTHALWSSFLRHNTISSDPLLQAVIPKLALSAKAALIKVGYPRLNNHPACKFSAMDFDSDADFNVFFSQYRADVAETIRLATKRSPHVTFDFVSQWLKEQLRKPIDVGRGASARDFCNLGSPSHLEWDALTVFLDSVMCRMAYAKQPQPPQENGVALLKSVLAYKTLDPLVMSSVMSCISSLFMYIKGAPEILPRVVDKIFATAVFNIRGQTKATRSKAVKNVRRHACSVLVKMCKQYPDLLLPGFEQLYAHVKKLSADPEELSQMEKCTFREALILISNQFKKFDKQEKFLGEILQPVRDMWLSLEYSESLWSVDKFMDFIGLTKAPVEPSTNDVSGINRSNLLYCVNTIMASLKRSSWPTNSDEAKSGGFMYTTDCGTIALRNPVTPHVGVMLDNVLALLRNLNALFLAEYLSRRHRAFASCYDLSENDRLALLGIYPPSADNMDAPDSKHPVDRMLTFLNTIHVNGLMILGNAAGSLVHEFYSAPKLAQSMLTSVLTSLDVVPDHRLRVLIRLFLKPYIQHCPPEYFHSALLPVLADFSAYMMQRLSAKWLVVNKRLEQMNGDEDEDIEEILEDQLNRQLTREFIEMLALCTYARRTPSALPDNDMQMEEISKGQPELGGLSELGKAVFKTENVYPAIVMCAFTGLSWNDTTACQKCISLCESMVSQLAIDKRLAADDVNHILTAIFLGLQLHGEHEGIQARLVNLSLAFYQAFRPTFPALAGIMTQIPGCTQEILTAFEEKFLTPDPDNIPPERRKKEAFRKLVTECIGKSLSQQFRKEAHIKNLPPLYRRAKLKPVVDVSETGDMGMRQLFKEKSKHR